MDGHAVESVGEGKRRNVWRKNCFLLRYSSVALGSMAERINISFVYSIDHEIHNRPLHCK